MEEEKAAAYYDELTRKGSGAARFKQGLGFSSAATTTDDPPPPRSSALPSSNSFINTFVKASTNPKETQIEVDNNKSQLLNIQNKLNKKGNTSNSSSIDDDVISRVNDRDRKRRSRNRERDSDSRRRRDDDDDRDRSRRRNRSSSRERRRYRSRSRDRRRRRRSRSRSFSPRDRRRGERGRDNGGGGEERGRRVVKKEVNGGIDYANLIHGYDKMTPAEKVKAKMKLQLSQTAKKDTKVGSGSNWERFEFNKDAPIDDKEIEATDDDASLVKHIGQSFRFTSLEAKRESQIENAHDEAMFGVPVFNQSSSESGEEGKSENENDNKGFKDEAPSNNLMNEKVLSKQQGSWRDRARKNVG